MKHLKKGRKFGRVTNQRTALLKHLSHALILHEKIQTTEAKAKTLRPIIEKLITKGRVDTLASRRLVLSRLGGEKEATKKLFDGIALQYKDRKGGYTRITKLPLRAGDASKQAMIEFV